MKLTTFLTVALLFFLAVQMFGQGLVPTAPSCWEEVYHFPQQESSALNTGYLDYLMGTTDLHKFVGKDMSFVIEHNRCQPSENRVREVIAEQHVEQVAGQEKLAPAIKTRSRSSLRKFFAIGSLIGSAAGSVVCGFAWPCLLGIAGGQLAINSLISRPPREPTTQSAKSPPAKVQPRPSDLVATSTKITREPSTGIRGGSCVNNVCTAKLE